MLTILTHIQAENPDAKILLLNQYNPYSHLDNAMVSALVGAFDAGVNGLNTLRWRRWPGRRASLWLTSTRPSGTPR